MGPRDISAPQFAPAQRRAVRTRLLQWYGEHKRDLPWRRRPTPYRVWVAETMLQQTQVATVIPYYRRFLKRFPSLKALADAREDDLLKVWEGLGYYTRGLNLLRAARRVRDEHGGRLPRTYEGLVSLPGIGRYTAGAVLSIAMGQDAPVLDGNVMRVLARLLDWAEDVTRAPVKEALWGVAERLVAPGRTGDFNQAMMELGSQVCVPRAPRCDTCPVRRVCRANAAGTQDDLPVKARRKPVPHYEIGVGVVWQGDRVLIARRPSTGLLAGLWEFPGGKQQPGETIRQCVRREVHEELGVDVSVGTPMMAVKHAYSHFRVTLHFYTCAYVAGRPRPLGCSAWRWVHPHELARYAFPAGSTRAVRAVIDFDKRHPLLRSTPSD